MAAKHILHLGLGSFHRAHQAVYLNGLREAGDTRWSIVAGNIRPDMAATQDALIEQGGKYIVETISPAGERHYERIASIERVIAYQPDLAPLIEIGAASSTYIISFTVTEAGYYLDTKNHLDTRYEDLRSDLAGNSRTTIYGALAAILAERMRVSSAPVTLLNCDNLRSNGARFRSGFLDFLDRRETRDLRAWVVQNTTCPNAMVDRITPRPLPEVAVRVRAATGVPDRAPVMAERFTQWVIEDHFCNERPPLENVGVEFVESVLPYEEAKIRVLNATHSCIAWAGTLIGLNHIHEGVAHPTIRSMAYDYVTSDVIPCLTTGQAVSPVDLPAYRDLVLERFSNPYLRDTNQRVAMDAFSKIPGFVVPTLRERLAVGAPIDKSAVLGALFFAFLELWSRDALPYSYQDQSMDPEAARAIYKARDPLAAFCANPVLWGPLAANQTLASAIKAALPAVAALRASSGA
jgi:D-arabinitol 4-dehydrogenase